MADRSVVYRLKADVTSFRAQMASAAASVKKAAGDMTDADKSGERFRRGLDSTGAVAGRVGLVAAAGLGATIKAAMDWESAWAGVTKTVDGSAAEMAKLEMGLRDLATSLPATHKEIAAVAEAAGQLGVAREDIVGFTRTMVNLGETTNLSADAAATSIAQMMNVMQSAPESVDRIGATLVALGNAGASTEAEIMAMAQRLSGVGRLIGASESDVLALASAMADLGLEAELGGGGMSRTLTKFSMWMKRGGEDVQQLAKTAGVSAAEFATAWESDPVSALNLWLQGLAKVKQEGGDVVGLLAEYGIKGTQDLQVILRMVGAQDGLTESLGRSADAWRDNTALVIEAAKRYDTTSSQVQVSWNQVKDAAIEAGEAMLPLVQKVAGAVGTVADAFAGLPGPVKAASSGLLGVTAVLGGGLWFTAKTINGVHAMRETLRDLGVASSTAEGGLTKVGKAAKGLGIAAAIAGAAVVIDDFVTATDKAATGAEKMTRGILGFKAAQGLTGDLKGLGDAVDRIFDKEWNESTDDWLRGKLPLFGDAKGLKEAKGEIESLDRALAGLVETGNQDMASRFIEGLDLSEKKTKALLDMLPQYDEALIGVQNSTNLAGDAAGNAATSTDAVAAAIERATGASDDNTESLKKNIDAMRERRQQQLAAENAEIAYHAAVAAAGDALKENGRTVDITTEKGRANRSALLDMASAWNDLSEKQKNSKGARQEAIRQFVDMAQRMGMGEDAARRLARRIFELKPKTIKVSVDTRQAEAEVERLRNTAARPIVAMLEIRRPKDFTDARSGLTFGKGDNFWSGGYTGDGGKYEPAGIVHRGEFVWDAETTRANRAFLEAVQGRKLPGYTAGGFVSGAAMAGPAIDYNRLAQSLAAMRPLYGDVHVSDGYGGFKQQMLDDRRQASLGVGRA